MLNEDPPRIAVVSPFLDKQHGTERAASEQVERLAWDYGYEVHLYCQRVEDVGGVEEYRGRGGAAGEPERSPGRIWWHRVSEAPGPHVGKFLWWMRANRRQRVRDGKEYGLKYDLVYSPGINCRDADAILIHVVFAELVTRIEKELELEKNPAGSWPRVLHRRIYYRLVGGLEKKIYPDERVTLGAVSGLTAREVQRRFGRGDVRVIPNGVDTRTFNPEERQRRRAESRRQLRLEERDFVLLLLGNGWKNKGLDCLLGAAARCPDLSLVMLVVGSDDRRPYQPMIEHLRLGERVKFLDPSADVMQYYAAADVYAGPSLYDTFGLPVVEAMACGLPVVTSATTGTAERITDGEDGFVLRDARNQEELAGVIRRLFAPGELRSQVGERAARKARQFGWEQNAQQTHELLQEALRRKRTGAGVGAVRS